MTGYYKNERKKVLDENQPREQAGFRKGFSTVGHLQTTDQLIENCLGFNRPLCIRYIDYEKAFDSIEHEAILKASRTTGINETYITVQKMSTQKLLQEYMWISSLKENTNTEGCGAGGLNFP